jgi:hypothetical protein
MTFSSAVREALQQHPPHHLSAPSVSLSFRRCETTGCAHDLAHGILVTDLLTQDGGYHLQYEPVMEDT